VEINVLPYHHFSCQLIKKCDTSTILVPLRRGVYKGFECKNVVLDERKPENADVTLDCESI